MRLITIQEVVQSLFNVSVEFNYNIANQLNKYLSYRRGKMETGSNIVSKWCKHSVSFFTLQLSLSLIDHSNHTKHEQNEKH